MTDTPMYENENIQKYISKSAEAKISAKRFSRLVLHSYLEKQKNELHDDFSKLNDANYARKFAYGLLKDIGISWLQNHGASDEAVTELATDANLHWLISAATKGQVDEESFSRLVTEHGEDFDEVSNQLFGNLYSIAFDTEKGSLAYRFLQDVEGGEIYTFLGEPELTDKITVGMFDSLQNAQKAAIVDLVSEKKKKNDKYEIDREDLENIILRGGRQRRRGQGMA